MQWNRDTAMPLNKEIQVQGFILGNALRALSAEVFEAAGKAPGEDLCCIHHPKRGSCQTNPFGSWLCFHLADSAWRGLRIWQNGAKQCQVWGTGELFLLLFLVQGAPGRAILALLCCSFQRSSLSQVNQMRVTSGRGASAKSLLFCSWQGDDVLQMPGSLWNVKCIPCIFFASSPASISLAFCFTNGQIQISFPDA